MRGQVSDVVNATEALLLERGVMHGTLCWFRSSKKSPQPRGRFARCSRPYHSSVCLSAGDMETSRNRQTRQAADFTFTFSILFVLELMNRM